MCGYGATPSLHYTTLWDPYCQPNFHIAQSVSDQRSVFGFSTHTQYSIFPRFFIFCFGSFSIRCSPCGHFSSHLLCTFGESVLLLMYSVAMALIFFFRSLALSRCRQAINDACLNLFMYAVLPLNRIISILPGSSPRCFLCLFFSPHFFLLQFLLPLRFLGFDACGQRKYTKQNIIPITTSEGIPNIMRIISTIVHCCGFSFYAKIRIFPFPILFRSAYGLDKNIFFCILQSGQWGEGIEFCSERTKLGWCKLSNHFFFRLYVHAHRNSNKT